MIDRFIAQVKTRGLARNNRFQVEIPGMGNTADDMEMVMLFCDSVSLPGLSLSTTPQRVYGEVREIPYEKMFDTINLTFYVDTQMIVKLMFDDWIHRTIDTATKQTNYYHDYVRDVYISVLPMDSEKPVYTVTLYEAYPKSVSPVQMDAASKDVMKLQVALNYKYYTIDTPEIQAIETKRYVDAPQDQQGVNTGTGYEEQQYPVGDEDIFNT